MNGETGRRQSPVIAIDGPAGSGKSTVARAVADRLGVAHLDTGAMYRAVTLAALTRDIDPADEQSVAALAGQVTISVGDRVVLDGEDVTVPIRDERVAAVVSIVAANPGVRTALVRQQRAWADQHGGGVVEGRDIGTVVFPGADVKVYLTATEEERSRRRAAETPSADLAAVARDLARRDGLDSSRSESPLAAADDAVVIDTTGKSVAEIVEEVLAQL